MRPHIKRVQLKHSKAWVWGLFKTPVSPRPFAMAGTVPRLIDTFNRWYARHHEPR